MWRGVESRQFDMLSKLTWQVLFSSSPHPHCYSPDFHTSNPWVRPCKMTRPGRGSRWWRWKECQSSTRDWSTVVSCNAIRPGRPPWGWHRVGRQWGTSRVAKCHRYVCLKILEGWGKNLGGTCRFNKLSSCVDKVQQLIWSFVSKPASYNCIFSICSP